MLKYISILLIALTLRIKCQSFTYETNVDYFGSDLAIYPAFVSTIEQCCSACNTDTRCTAWTYLPATGACWLKCGTGQRRVDSVGRYSGLRQATCTAPIQPVVPTVPSTTPATTTTQPATTTTTRAVPTTTTKPATVPATVSTTTKAYGCLIENNINYNGNDIGGAFVASATDCCNLCGQTASCVAWSYLIQEQYCYMKNKIDNGSRVDYDGFISGVVVGK